MAWCITNWTILIWLMDLLNVILKLRKMSNNWCSNLVQVLNSNKLNLGFPSSYKLCVPSLYIFPLCKKVTSTIMVDLSGKKLTCFWFFLFVILCSLCSITLDHNFTVFSYSTIVSAILYVIYILNVWWNGILASLRTCIPKQLLLANYPVALVLHFDYALSLYLVILAINE